MSAAAPFLRAFLLAVISLLTGPFRLHAAGIDPYKLEEIQTLIAGSQFDEADRLMRAALIDAPNDVDLICLRGTVAVMRDELPQAEALFRESLQIRPKEDRFIMNLAEILYRQGKYQEAAPMYARISKRHPVRPLAQYKQILCFLLADDRATAANLTESLDLTPGDPAFLYAHAALAYYDGDTAAARYFAESARRLYRAPSDVFRLPLIEQGWVTDS